MGGGEMNCESPKTLLHLMCIKYLLSEQLSVCLQCFDTASATEPTSYVHAESLPTKPKKAEGTEVL